MLYQQRFRQNRCLDEIFVEGGPHYLGAKHSASPEEISTLRPTSTSVERQSQSKPVWVLNAAQLHTSCQEALVNVGHGTESLVITYRASRITGVSRFISGNSRSGKSLRKYGKASIRHYGRLLQ